MTIWQQTGGIILAAIDYGIIARAAYTLNERHWEAVIRASDARWNASEQRYRERLTRLRGDPMTACRWCGGDTTQPGHDHTLRHQFWLFIAQVLYLS